MTVLVPPTIVPTESVLDRFRARVAAAPDAEALRTLDGETLTWGAWHEASRAFAAAVLAEGLAPGARIAVLAGNRPLWPIADVGTLMAGMVGVGLYPSSAPSQVEEILGDCQARVVVVDTAEQLAKVLAVRDRLPALRRIVAVEIPAALAEGLPGDAQLRAWPAWLRAGRGALAVGVAVPHALDLARRRTRLDDTAVLIYTSGSTGRPKGACISHATLAASAESIASTLGLTSADSSLSFLPFCHAAERMFGLYTRIHVGMPAMLVDDPARVWDAARAYEPTLFGGLPRWFEKIAERLRLEAARAPEADRPRWTRAVELGRLRSRLRREGGAAAAVPAELERAWRESMGVARPVIESFLGRRVRVVTSGGAALPVEVAELLDALGVTVLGAYGQTEHLCVSMHRPDRYGFDSAGWPMPGTEPRLAADGELLVRRSALTFSGYHGCDEETRAAFTPDGEWLLTGDLAEVTDDGRLRITGRKKELIALSTGKKVAPLPIEATLADGQWISHALVHGEGRRFVTALLCLARPAAEAWAVAHGVEADLDALVRHPGILAAVQTVVDRANAGLSRTEQVRRWVLLPRELTVEAGELTPTLKLRRADVTARYAPLLDALYDSGPSTLDPRP